MQITIVSMYLSVRDTRLNSVLSMITPHLIVHTSKYFESSIIYISYIIVVMGNTGEKRRNYVQQTTVYHMWI